MLCSSNSVFPHLIYLCGNDQDYVDHRALDENHERI